MTLTLKEAVHSEQILKEAFAEVYINGTDHDPTVIARGWNRTSNPSDWQLFYRLRKLPIPQR